MKRLLLALALAALTAATGWPTAARASSHVVMYDDANGDTNTVEYYDSMAACKADLSRSGEIPGNHFYCKREDTTPNPVLSAVVDFGIAHPVVFGVAFFLGLGMLMSLLGIRPFIWFRLW